MRFLLDQDVNAGTSGFFNAGRKFRVIRVEQGRKKGMAENRLSGRRSIDEIFWSDVMRAPGDYLFFMTINGPPRYVGRADTDLYRRVASRPYKYYQYKHTDYDVDVYHWECKCFHRYHKTIDNRNHPAKPKGLKGWIECPEWHA